MSQKTVKDVKFEIKKSIQPLTSLAMHYLLSDELQSVDPIHRGELFEPVTSFFTYGLLHKVKKDFIFLDIGANIGHYSVMAAGLRPDATVYAFEPHEKVFETLSKNAELYTNIKAFNCGISKEEKDDVILYCDNRNVGGHSYINTEETWGDKKGFQPSIGMYEMKTQLKRMSSFDIDWNRVEVVKIDTQGFETEILGDITDNLKSGTIVLIERCEGLSDLLTIKKYKTLYEIGIEIAVVKL